ncbi:testicular acid phosphatase homolog isoform X2 [Pleurodeles waltl]|uniref:testicular acid phosphatase homolog isoform X2 n=1 Tax=Pleurodeles waltl TaxID=8319 RepID=UPI003709A11E
MEGALGWAPSIRCWLLLGGLWLQLIPGGVAQRKLKLVTLIGMQQHYELGQYLKKRYQGFLSATYNRDEIYVCSTDLDRTLMSAETNLAGMYPPTGKQIWNPNLLWQPIPVHSVSWSEEQFLHFTLGNCPRFEELLKETVKSTQFQTLIKPYQDFIKKLINDTGYSEDFLISKGKLWIVYDTLLCEEIHKLALPTWATPDVRATLLKVSQILVKALFGLYKQEEKSRLQGGRLVDAILKNFTDFVTTPTKRKMIIYSAHDTTLLALQIALNVFNDQLPPYAACHIFELHQEDNGQYSIDMFYRNHTGTNPHALLLPGCGTPCTLQRFSDLVSPIIVKDWKKECGIQDGNCTNGTIIGLAVTVSLMGLIIIILLILYCRKSPECLSRCQTATA